MKLYIWVQFLSLHIRFILVLQEFYADFVATDPYHFTLNMPSNHMYMLPAVVDHSNLQRFCDRVVDGIAAVFLALKRRPVIRYQRTSDIAKRIAQETAVSIICSKKFCMWACIDSTILNVNFIRVLYSPVSLFLYAQLFMHIVCHIKWILQHADSLHESLYRETDIAFWACNRS